MNDALIQWLMAPEAGEATPLDLEAVLHRPGWHQRAACRGIGVEAFVIDRGGEYSRRDLCQTVPGTPGVSRRRPGRPGAYWHVGTDHSGGPEGAQAGECGGVGIQNPERCSCAALAQP